MKTLMTPIEVIAHFDIDGKLRPLRLKLEGEVVRIDQVVSMTEEKLAGNRMMCFKCQSEIDGVLTPFEIKYELGTCKWFLFKM